MPHSWYRSQRKPPTDSHGGLCENIHSCIVVVKGSTLEEEKEKTQAKEFHASAYEQKFITQRHLKHIHKTTLIIFQKAQTSKGIYETR